MRLAANVLSVLLHPLWMPTITIVLCFGIDPYMSYGFDKGRLMVFYGVFFAMTAVFPLISALLMKRSGLVSELAMPLRRERLPVYLMTLIYHGMCYFMVLRALGNPVTLGIFTGALLGLFLVLVITFWWKISVHMMGIGGLIGAILAVVVLDDRDAPMPLCVLFVLAGVLGTARLIASDHTSAQIYAGALLGCGCVYGCAAFGLMI